MKFQFCPYCRSKLEKRDTLFVCKENKHKIYKNSYPSVAVIPIKNNQILLGRRAKDPAKGTWDVIGGFTDPGEHPKDAAIREAKEESNLDVEILDIVEIYMDKYVYEQVKSDVMVIYYVVKATGDPQPADDVSELKWFDIDDLPEEDFAFDHLKEGLEDVKKWLINNS